MNCDDCIERLDPYVDRELTENEIDEVRVHLAECPPCGHQVELRTDLKRLVKVCLEDQPGASPELRQRLQHLLA
ncbi:MAG: zf-HC2 domain-containing protein [Candidatus Dormibacteraeota bacterium]|nr:zf-HC2 domain-containing protein [Candidatus Dormibacteraeota bacterium]MBO0745827.1 zf-HC2 domain-containing protein [Candidatus Dormibacteraeota bacterium]